MISIFCLLDKFEEALLCLEKLQSNLSDTYTSRDLSQALSKANDAQSEVADYIVADGLGGVNELVTDNGLRLRHVATDQWMASVDNTSFWFDVFLSPNLPQVPVPVILDEEAVVSGLASAYAVNVLLSDRFPAPFAVSLHLLQLWDTKSNSFLFNITDTDISDVVALGKSVVETLRALWTLNVPGPIIRMLFVYLVEHESSSPVDPAAFLTALQVSLQK